MYKYIEKWNRKTLLKIVCIDFCQQRYQQFGEDSKAKNKAQLLLDNLKNRFFYRRIFYWIGSSFCKSSGHSKIHHHFYITLVSIASFHSHNKTQNSQNETTRSFTVTNCVKNTKTESINKSVCYKSLSRILFSAQL